MSGVESRIPFGADREVSRRNFLKTAGWAGAALSAAGIGGFGVAVQRVNAQAAPYTTYQDLTPADILGFAYLLELLEGTFYAEGVNAGIFNDFATTQIAEIRDNEMEHADFLAAGLEGAGAAVPETPMFTYPEGVFADPVAFLDLAATFEPVGIGGYQGAAPVLMGTEFLTPALQIHNAEGMHRVAINVLQGVDPPNNRVFGEALPLPVVQEAVAPFGVPV